MLILFCWSQMTIDEMKRTAQEQMSRALRDQSRYALTKFDLFLRQCVQGTKVDNASSLYFTSSTICHRPSYKNHKVLAHLLPLATTKEVQTKAFKISPWTYSFKHLMMLPLPKLNQWAHLHMIQKRSRTCLGTSLFLFNHKVYTIGWQPPHN